jgi:hypothetical protein
MCSVHLWFDCNSAACGLCSALIGSTLLYMALFTLPCWGKYQCSYIADSVLLAAAACFLENAAADVNILGRGKHP